MKAMWRTIGAAMAMVLLTGVAWADEGAPSNPEELAKAFAEAGKPGPEHAKLKPLAGRWSYTCKLWMDPSQPAVETKGTLERKWVLGGRFLEETYAGTGPDGKPGFEARGLLGYDKGQGKYTSTFACSMGTGICTGVGVSNASDSFTFQTECVCPVLKTVVKGRDEVRIEGSDRVVMTSYKIEDGKEVKMMELVATRDE